MLLLLSPAKSLDYDTPNPVAATATPHFAARAGELIGLLRTQSVDDIAALMKLSPALAELNVNRYAAWSPRFTARNSRAAVMAFDGDVYEGLAARTLGADDLAWANEHLAILSGLYGVLRPLDRLQPYRLEMGTALAGPHGRTLYDYWGDTLAEYLNRLSAKTGSPVIVNLASMEYFRAADRQALKPRVIECVFEDWKGGRYKIISFYAKRARGLMARHLIRQRALHPQVLDGFDAEGYAFVPEASEPERLVFRRRVAGVE